ncbi:MAG: hypothetical protein ABJP66_17780 [Hyphomicrobiales bacterium]
MNDVLFNSDFIQRLNKLEKETFCPAKTTDFKLYDFHDRKLSPLLSSLRLQTSGTQVLAKVCILAVLSTAIFDKIDSWLFDVAALIFVKLANLD